MSPELMILLSIVGLWLIAGVILWGSARLPFDGDVKNIIKVVVIVIGGILTIVAIFRLFRVPLL